MTRARFPLAHWAANLAGATLVDRLLAALGAFFGITLTGIASYWLAMHFALAPWLIAPIGASAVLVFAVPASPLAQPWAVIGGNCLSAAVGLAIVHLGLFPPVAAALAVALAIALMALTRSLHPPGGAAAMLVALNGPQADSAHLAFLFAPVALNAILLVVSGWIFHRFSRHTYPHRPLAPVVIADSLPALPTLDVEEIQAAIAESGETFDIALEDLERLLQIMESHLNAPRVKS